MRELVAKINVPPSRMIAMVRMAVEIAARLLDCRRTRAMACSSVRMPSFPVGGISRLWVGRLQAAAQNAGGSGVILSCSLSGELTRQAIWGKPAEAVMLMEAVRKQFDPKQILNPGRFVYSS